MEPDQNSHWQILVVDDDPDTAGVVSKLVNRKFGADVSVASDCASARDALANERIDAVILDYQLPDGNGLQLLEELSSMEDGPAVVLVTGEGGEKIAAEAFRLKASGYVVKDSRLLSVLPEVIGVALTQVTLRRAQETLRRTERAERALLAEMEQRVKERTRELEQANAALRTLAQQVQQQATMLDEILSASPDHFYLVDRNGKYIYASRAAATALGLEQDDLTGRHPWDMGLPEETVRALEIQRESVFSTDTPRTGEIGFPGREGPRVLECVMSPIHGPNGEVRTVVVTARDVTERREALKELERQRAVLEEQAQLLDLPYDTIMVRDMNNVILFWNSGGEKTYGWSKDEAMGKVSHELLKTVFPRPLEEIEFELLRDGRWEGQLEQQTRDMRRMKVSSRWALKWAEDGAPEAILEIANEISD